MLTIIYQLILICLIVLLGTAVYTEKKFSLRLTAAIALIPFLLRLLMIK
jgi:hypothetical protein